MPQYTPHANASSTRIAAFTSMNFMKSIDRASGIGHAKSTAVRAKESK